MCHRTPKIFTCIHSPKLQDQPLPSTFIIVSFLDYCNSLGLGFFFLVAVVALQFIFIGHSDLLEGHKSFLCHHPPVAFLGLKPKALPMA